VGARDVVELRDVYESFEATTAAAEDVMATAVRLAEAEGLAVMALGRLGGGEFDLLSDADVLFVCDEGDDRIALTKCAEKMMHVLSAYTREGTVFSLDARLRPRGGEGELLSTPAQLTAYFEQEAQPWEALMYTKMRFLAGSQALGNRATGTLTRTAARAPSDRPSAAAVLRRRTDEFAALMTRDQGSQHRSRIQLLVDSILPGLPPYDPNLSPGERTAQAIESNIRWTVHQILSTPEAQARLKEGRIKIVGALFEIATGSVRFLDS